MGFLQISKNFIYLFRKSKNFFPYDFALARLARMQKDYVIFFLSPDLFLLGYSFISYPQEKCKLQTSWPLHHFCC